VEILRFFRFDPASDGADAASSLFAQQRNEGNVESSHQPMWQKVPPMRQTFK